MVRVSTFAEDFRCTKDDSEDYPYTIEANDQNDGGAITLYLSEAGLSRLKEVITNPISTVEEEAAEIVETDGTETERNPAGEAALDEVARNF